MRFKAFQKIHFEMDSCTFIKLEWKVSVQIKENLWGSLTFRCNTKNLVIVLILWNKYLLSLNLNTNSTCESGDAKLLKNSMFNLLNACHSVTQWKLIFMLFENDSDISIPIYSNPILDHTKTYPKLYKLSKDIPS